MALNTLTGDYTDLLQTYAIEISTSREGNPWDNAACESFVKTLNYEEVHLNEYRNLAEAHAAIHLFPEQVYNKRRLHSALGYQPPAEFERHLTAQNESRGRVRDGVLEACRGDDPLRGMGMRNEFNCR